LFKDNGLEHILSQEKGQDDKEVLLIYDNIENIQTNHIDFLWHIKAIMGYSIKLKLIIIQGTK
jgi:hypothetical protein